MNIEQAVKQFREAAIAKADGAEPAETDHALHELMAVAWKFLEKQGATGREAFSSLLMDESPYVRLWVAAQLLSEGKGEAAQTVEAEVSSGGLRGFTAEMILEEWEAGRLGSPFGNE